MTFHSILFGTIEDSIIKETLEAPPFFADLNLDQIIDAIIVGKQEYNLKPFFYTSLNDIGAIEYRHEIMRDLENKIVFEHIKSFAQKMREMREHLFQANKLYYGVYGIYYALTEGVAKSLVAHLVEERHMGAAFGLYNASLGLLALPASTIAGFLWDKINPSAPFYFGFLCAILAVVLISGHMKKKKKGRYGLSTPSLSFKADCKT